MTDDSMADGLICYKGRTPEQELQHRVDNFLSLRDRPPSEEESRRMMEAVFEEWGETFRLLADT